MAIVSIFNCAEEVEEAQIQVDPFLDWFVSQINDDKRLLSLFYCVLFLSTSVSSLR